MFCLMPRQGSLLVGEVTFSHAFVPAATNQQYSLTTFMQGSEATRAPTRFWYLYDCRSESSSAATSRATCQAAAVNRARVSFGLKNREDACRYCQLPLPPIEEQRRIAAVLDAAEALRAKRRLALAKLDSLNASDLHRHVRRPGHESLGMAR